MKLKDLTGKKFGRLTVLSHAGNSGKPGYRTHWKCKCNCGVIKNIAKTSLLNGVTKSCGCLKKELIKYTNNK